MPEPWQPIDLEERQAEHAILDALGLSDTEGFKLTRALIRAVRVTEARDIRLREPRSPVARRIADNLERRSVKDWYKA